MIMGRANISIKSTCSSISMITWQWALPLEGGKSASLSKSPSFEATPPPCDNDNCETSTKWCWQQHIIKLVPINKKVKKLVQKEVKNGNLIKLGRKTAPSLSCAIVSGLAWGFVFAWGNIWDLSIYIWIFEDIYEILREPVKNYLADFFPSAILGRMIFREGRGVTPILPREKNAKNSYFWPKNANKRKSFGDFPLRGDPLFSLRVFRQNDYPPTG